MQPRFEINGTYFLDPENSVLAIQAGPGYLAYAVCDALGSKLGMLKWYTAATDDLAGILKDIPGVQDPLQKKIIAFDFPAYTLLPAELNQGDNSALLHLAGADPQDHILNEYVGTDIALNYSVPFTLLNLCIHHIPGASYWHLQKIRIAEVLGDRAGSVMDVNIIDHRFSVVAAKDGGLLLAQHYTYRAPEDVLFYLLKIAEVYGLAQTELQLNISGLIDADAQLYKMLYAYFLNIRLMNAGWAEEPALAYPAHYFTTLKQVALCELSPVI
ncbi:DUF3822 family protein [Niabella drilacis]|uniref:DUF3822 domain-containing protein n=1 Tax=Niabella drilacis (strain DSM 25811 / CCM 8410 / CCUG 62505 / LMG 26954 / E90) TaxID=1285928 RepID=A0A1G6YCE8_NIADE|nr:DUF3822 family protein [Niabella drilacis]SDD88002.1 Protein of unknown function [Niabella drilacis]